MTVGQKCRGGGGCGSLWTDLRVWVFPSYGMVERLTWEA